MSPPGTGSDRKVLVLGNDCRSFLTVIRSFGRAGFTVHAAWAPSGLPALRSRYLRRYHQIPLPQSGAASASDAIPALRELLVREQYDLVIPCNDESILPIRAAGSGLPPSSRIYLLNEAAHAVCSSKARTQELASSLGIPVPQSEPVARIGDLSRPLSEYHLPLVIKPVSSFDQGDVSTRRSVSKVYRRELALPTLERALEAGPVLLQENVIGIGVGVEILADQGEIRTVFQHERVHEPLHGGGSSYRRSVPVSPSLLDATTRLAAAIRYHGVGMFEYKVDLRTGQWYLIEINGRFWGSLPLAVAAGADFPLYLYQMLIEGRREFPRGFRTDLYCRNLIADIEWFRDNLSADKQDPTLATRTTGQVLGELKQILLLRERSDTFCRDDLAPGFQELAIWVGDLWRRVIRRLIKRGGVPRVERAG